MSFLDTFLQRKPKPGTVQFYEPSAPPSQFNNLVTSGQPVPVAQLIQPRTELTSGSSLNKTAFGAWPQLIDAGYKFYNGGWRFLGLRAPWQQTLRGNYAGANSRPDWGFRYAHWKGIAGYPLEGFPSPYIPEYNDLIPIQWNVKVPNENTDSSTGYYNAAQGNITKNQPATFVPTGTASLKGTGINLL
jgi:hypothetical protein